MRSFRHYISFLALFFIVFSCKNQTPVGGDQLPISNVVTIDTLENKPLMTQEYLNYSGNNTYLSVGSIHDPAFGDYDITAYFKPGLISVTSDIDTIRPESPMRIQFITASTFGDTTLAVDYNLYELAENWRGNETFYNTELTKKPGILSSISVPAGTDTFYVNLPLSWSQMYRDIYYADTSSDSALKARTAMYQNNFLGFALESPSASAIKIFGGSQISVQIVEEDTTLNIALTKWALFSKSTNLVDYSGSEFTVLDSFTNPLVSFDLNVEVTDSLRINGQTIKSRNLAKAELLFYADTLTANAGRPASFASTGVGAATIYSTTFDFLGEAFLGRGASFPAIKKDGIYRANITSMINVIVLGLDDETVNNTLFITLRTNDGFFTHELIYNHLSAQYHPKIVLTYMKTEGL